MVCACIYRHWKGCLIFFLIALLVTVGIMLPGYIVRAFLPFIVAIAVIRIFQKQVFRDFPKYVTDCWLYVSKKGLFPTIQIWEYRVYSFIRQNWTVSGAILISLVLLVIVVNFTLPWVESGFRQQITSKQFRNNQRKTTARLPPENKMPARCFGGHGVTALPRHKTFWRQPEGHGVTSCLAGHILAKASVQEKPRLTEWGECFSKIVIPALSALGVITFAFITLSEILKQSTAKQFKNTMEYLKGETQANALGGVLALNNLAMIFPDYIQPVKEMFSNVIRETTSKPEYQEDQGEGDEHV